MNRTFTFWLLACAVLSAQQIPAPTGLPGDPFFIKKTWLIPGNRETLTSIAFDTVQLRLFVAFSHQVVAYDVDSPAVIATVSRVNDASGIALDDTGEFGFISEGRLGRIDVFDRRTLHVVGFVPTAANPSWVMFDPVSALVFVICNEPVIDTKQSPPFASSPSQRSPAPSRHASPPLKPAPPSEFKWSVTVIDANTWEALANIQLPGIVGFAQTAGGGHIYLSLPSRSELARLDSVDLRQLLDAQRSDPQSTQQSTPKDDQLQAGPADYAALRARRALMRVLDWSSDSLAARTAERPIAFFPLDRLQPQCGQPTTLAPDEHHLRLFVACSKATLAVLNADNGDLIATLPTGPDTNAVAYDSDRRLIYAANAGGNGSLTIITQDSTDSYQVVQNLPTPHWARALAVNPATGQAYLATDYTDADAEERLTTRIKGSFQLLLIGH